MVSLKWKVGLIFIGGLLGMCIVYCSHLFTYCSHGYMNNDYLVTGERKEMYEMKLKEKCEDVFKLNGKEEYLFFIVIKVVNKLCFNIEIEDNEYENYSQWINETNLNLLLLQMDLMKYCYVVVFIIVGYFLFVDIPRYVVEFVLMLFTKMLTGIYIFVILDFLLYVIHQTNISGITDKVSKIKENMHTQIINKINNLPI